MPQGQNAFVNKDKPPFRSLHISRYPTISNLVFDDSLSFIIQYVIQTKTEDARTTTIRGHQPNISMPDEDEHDSRVDGNTKRLHSVYLDCVAASKTVYACTENNDDPNFKWVFLKC